MIDEPNTKQTWEELLGEAATACDTDVETFVRGAWIAYFAARPGARERLEEMQLRAQLDELRKDGRIAQA